MIISTAQCDESPHLFVSSPLSSEVQMRAFPELGCTHTAIKRPCEKMTELNCSEVLPVLRFVHVAPSGGGEGVGKMQNL